MALTFFYVFLTVHHSIELFHLPTLMHNSLFINNIYYTIILDMLRALTCPSSGGKILFTQNLVSSLSVNGCTVHRLRADCSQPMYCTAVYRERRYQLLCEYNFSSWRFITDCSAVSSQLVYCTAVYREWRYQMLCEYNFSSWTWAC